MARTRNAGFTLTELMVAIGLVALLVVFLLPFVQGAFDVQRRLYCANNLEKLGQAYATRTSEKQATFASGWTGGLRPYVGGVKSVFFCPEDHDPQVDTEVLNDVFIECYADGGINDPTKVTWRVYFNEGGISSHDYAPWVWQLSSTQYANRAALLAEFKTQSPRRGIPYVPDSNPNTWYIVWEDQGWHGGGDENFNDLNCKIEFAGDYVYITPIQGGASYNFTLAMTSDGRRTVIMDNMKSYWSMRTKVDLLNLGGSTSYGMNSVADKIKPMYRKALIMDYSHAIALGSAYEESFPLAEQQEQMAVWQDPNGTGLAWARHFKQINTLFADGSVVLVAPQQINPNYLDVQKKYWDP